MNENITELIKSEETRKLGVILAKQNGWDDDRIVEVIPPFIDTLRENGRFIRKDCCNWRLVIIYKSFDGNKFCINTGILENLTLRQKAIKVNNPNHFNKEFINIITNEI